MNGFALLLGLMIVILSAKPSIIRARKHVRDARLCIAELRHRRFVLGQKLRALARESLGQRLTAGHDHHESDDLKSRIATIRKRVEELEAVDRRVLVHDERRGLAESGWIVAVRRARSAAPPAEPPPVTKLWDEGRYVFVYAADSRRARRKATIRFPEDQGFEIMEIFAHEGDLTEVPKVGAALASAQ